MQALEKREQVSRQRKHRKHVTAVDKFISPPSPVNNMSNNLPGPYILKDHDELCRNTIKDLCNADISEGIFVAGKDVSLLETTIRNPKRPLRNLGGKRVSQRPILAFFAGNMIGPVRSVPNFLSIGGTKMNP
uniref:Probable glycosyltransferase At5g03795 n=1 Tax=Nicotiana tabacum TaxID=4097 RepID=A0A1S4CD55_TOBAC|nr:PREDICTED: probable glycosyltransferase At5g03795 [Nicotiana tabacum]